MSFVKTYEEIIGNSPESGDFRDAEMLTLVWETTPEAIQKLLPPPLKPAQKPVALAFVANYPSTNFSLPYQESALLIRSFGTIVADATQILDPPRQTPRL